MNTPTIDVVAGLLVRPGALLFTQRANHQTHSGEWEFPGGKVELGETKVQALARELEEEIGVHIVNHQFLLSSPAIEGPIHLHFYLVTQWDGIPRGCEGQPLGWYSRSWFSDLPLLPSNRALLDALLAAVDRYSPHLHDTS